MSEVSVNITMDEELRDNFRSFCANIGLSMSAVISRLARHAVDTKTIPAEDPFYSAVNIRRLEKAVDDVRSGRAVLTEHELIDAD
ncbi:MAG: type II toxin-antitoxin system RelB/DinJ family antitoxin [Synergistaceae bacterium]|nr:type II toxin-antitoxin system RelB/DinJ family antitoxin [Synergistaceae bacterium]MBQ6982868.1 type II toxin-antitoxin system RelB/DinJ family antitoxin [Synergistaceae bacterium]